MSKIEEKRWGKFESVAIINGQRGKLKISQIKPATYIYDVMVRKMSGSYLIKIDMVKLTCHNFIALTSGIIRIAYDIDEHPRPPKDRKSAHATAALE